MKGRYGKECYSIKQDESLTKEGPNNLWGYHFESANRKSYTTSCLYILKAHATSDLQPHYNNGVFGNIYFLALDITVDSGNSKRLNSEQSLISKHFW